MDHPHSAFSWGKDLTGGPSPRAPSPGFLRSQQRPENRPGHDDAPRPQHPASLSSLGVSWQPPGGYLPCLPRLLQVRANLAPCPCSTTCGFGGKSPGCFRVHIFSVLSIHMGLGARPSPERLHLPPFPFPKPHRHHPVSSILPEHPDAALYTFTLHSEACSLLLSKAAVLRWISSIPSC